MLRSLCQLAAHRAASCALRPAVTLQGGSLQALRGHPVTSAVVSSQNVVCQYSTCMRPTSCLSLKSVSGFQPALNTQPGVVAGLTSLLSPALPCAGPAPCRTVTKWTLSKGKRKTVNAVLRRFKRLHWGHRGIWIRARAAAKKRIWKKSPAQRDRSKTHVFCNATQSNMLDKMVTRYWRKMRHYPDDPYAPYMKRDNFTLTNGYPREFY
ncbi:39S ribosomal protein L35, mitochondrial [Chionoecetes opilio]|uniref:Large ribosomal subunit protein bL35m n=1 Tax=Chionoecetes opilio TaxID=41210 RepID=A0A8J8WEC3_CHIOP|nr:39S ribosomal protein L35, mitochondrial [Chionoecetes opilio]